MPRGRKPKEKITQTEVPKKKRGRPPKNLSPAPEEKKIIDNPPIPEEENSEENKVTIVNTSEGIPIKVTVYDSGFVQKLIKPDDQFLYLTLEQDEVQLGMDLIVDSKKIIFSHAQPGSSYFKRYTFTIRQFISLLKASERKGMISVEEPTKGSEPKSSGEPDAKPKATRRKQPGAKSKNKSK